MTRPQAGTIETGRASGRKRPAAQPTLLLRPPSLRARAYEEIERRINTLAFKPGDFLSEAHIVQILGIGRMPVREALSQLDVEGIVEVVPRKGVVVKPVSLNDVLEIIEVRLLLEVRSAALAAERANREDLHAMARLLDESRRLIEPRDLEGSMNLDRRFHALIANATRSRTLTEILRGLHNKLLRFWFLSLAEHQHLQRIHDEHLSIYEAIARGDPEAARQAMLSHIEAFRTNIVRAL